MYFYREGKGGEREGEKHWCERETSISWLSSAPWPGPDPATQACGLTGIAPTTFHFVGWCPTNWAEPVRVIIKCFWLTCNNTDIHLPHLTSFHLLLTLLSWLVTTLKTFASFCTLYKWNHTVFFLIWLPLLHITFVRFIHIVLCHRSCISYCCVIFQ